MSIATDLSKGTKELFILADVTDIIDVADVADVADVTDNRCTIRWS